VGSSVEARSTTFDVGFVAVLADMLLIILLAITSLVPVVMGMAL
jgi:hypothetical protein